MWVDRASTYLPEGLEQGIRKSDQIHVNMIEHPYLQPWCCPVTRKQATSPGNVSRAASCWNSKCNASINVPRGNHCGFTWQGITVELGGYFPSDSGYFPTVVLRDVPAQSNMQVATSCDERWTWSRFLLVAVTVEHCTVAPELDGIRFKKDHSIVYMSEVFRIRCTEGMYLLLSYVCYWYTWQNQNRLVLVITLAKSLTHTSFVLLTLFEIRPCENVEQHLSCDTIWNGKKKRQKFQRWLRNQNIHNLQ